MRWRSLVLPVLTLTVGGLLVAGVRPVDREGWLDDFRVLRDSMAVGYANLDHMIEAKRVDVVALDSATEAAIRGARTEREARAAVMRFLAAFGDGHLRVEREPPLVVQRAMYLWKTRRASATERPTRAWKAADACAALGYSEGSAGWSLPFDDQPGYHEVGAMGPMRAGLIASGSDTIGLVRIALFSPHEAKSACVKVWNAVARERLYLGPCDDACESLVYDEVGETMLATLAEWLRSIRSQGPRTVLVDLAGNGGGTEWVDAAARLFAKGALRSPYVTQVRHPHTAAQIERRIASLDSAIAWPGVSEPLRDALREAREVYASLGEEVQASCDRTEIWHDPAVAEQCPGTLPLRLHTTGALAWLPDGAFDGAPEAALLYAPAARRTGAGAWNARVVILQDHATASASEEFIATLHDAGRAKTIGEKTLGAGCGYTDGGIPLTLPHSGLKVRMPDCARVRKDGTNEVFGIAPDVPVKLDVAAVLRAARLSS